MKYPAKNPAKFLKLEPEPDIEPKNSGVNPPPPLLINLLSQLVKKISIDHISD